MSSRLQALKASDFNRSTAPCYSPFYHRFSFDPPGVRRAGMIVQSGYGVRVLVTLVVEGRILGIDPDTIQHQPLTGDDALRPEGLLFERWFNKDESLTFHGTEGR